jgi:hypothetical protein
MKKWGVRYFADAEIIEWGSYEKSAKILKNRLKFKHCRIMYERIQKRMNTEI